MVSRTVLLVYNFGVAAILAMAAAFSTYAVQVAERGTQVTEMPTFDAEARTALEKQPDMEHLRARALFYFDLARELKKSRSIETLQLIYDARRLSLILSGLFFLGGVLVLVLSPRTSAQPQGR